MERLWVVPDRALEQHLEPLVWEKFMQFVNDIEFVKEVFEKVKVLHHAYPHKKEIDRLKAKLIGLNSQIEDFECFAKYYRQILTEEMNPDKKKQVLQKFIRKVEVGVDSVKVHFIIDGEHFKTELSVERQSKTHKGFRSASNSDFFMCNGSNTLKNGGPGENRTPTPLRVLDFESSASTNSTTGPSIHFPGHVMPELEGPQSTSEKPDVQEKIAIGGESST